MVLQVNIDILVPLLILVSLGISQSCRNINLNSLLGVKGWRLIPRELGEPPELGVMSYIHFANNLVLYFAFIIVLSSFEGGLIAKFTVRSVEFTTISLIIITGIVWLITPLLAFEEYSSIPPTDDWGHPESFNIHILMVLLSTIVLSVAAALFRFSAPPPELDPIRLASNLLTLVSIVILYLGTIHYLRALERELRN